MSNEEIPMLNIFMDFWLTHYCNGFSIYIYIFSFRGLRPHRPPPGICLWTPLEDLCPPSTGLSPPKQISGYALDSCTQLQHRWRGQKYGNIFGLTAVRNQKFGGVSAPESQRIHLTSLVAAGAAAAVTMATVCDCVRSR